MDPRTLIEACFAVAAFFAANWIRGIRVDVHELVKTVRDHGERLAVVESQVADLRREK